MQQLRADYINCSNLYSLWHKSLDACSDICVYVLYIYVSEKMYLSELQKHSTLRVGDVKVIV